MQKNLFLLAIVFSPLFTIAGPVDVIADENCGVADAPTWYDRYYLSKQKTEQAAIFQRCIEHNETRQKQRIENQTAELQNIVSKSHESCKQAIRRIAPKPETLSFDYANRFSYGYGLNGSGVDTTDGGYSVQVTGTDMRGKFGMKCYMNKQFVVTSMH